jgi:hypothetical protein
MMDNLCSFVQPAVAEFEAAGLVGWHVEAAKIGFSVTFGRRSERIDHYTDTSEGLRWAVWVTLSTLAYGPTLAAALADARAQGWTP